MVIKEKEYMTVQDVADALRISLRKAYTEVENHMDHHRLGKGKLDTTKRCTYRIPISAFKEYLAATLVTPQQKLSPPPPAPRGLPPGVKRYV